MRFHAVSDLHITGSEDPLYASLLKLIRERLEPGDVCVLAGDIFDLFVGDKPVFRSRYSKLLNALSEAGTRGVRLHYIEGNHDFLVRRAFSRIPGLSVHNHHFTAELSGKRFFIAHGDTVDRSDYGYRVLRTFLRSPVTRAFVAVTPGSLLDRLGRSSSDRSRRANQRKAELLTFKTERMQELRTIYRSFAAERLAEGYDFVVLGHCHDLDEMRFTIGGRSGHYMNIGYPRMHGSYLVWSPGEELLGRQALPEPS